MCVWRVLNVNSRVSSPAHFRPPKKTSVVQTIKGTHGEQAVPDWRIEALMHSRSAFSRQTLKHESHRDPHEYSTELHIICLLNYPSKFRPEQS